jgi:hypothetical protein
LGFGVGWFVSNSALGFMIFGLLTGNADKIGFYFLIYVVVESHNILCDAVRNRQIDESEGRVRKILVSAIRSIIISKFFFILVVTLSFILLYFMFLSV